MSSKTSLSIARSVESKWQSEGRGSRVRRSIGRPELTNLDPFLLLDEFDSNAADGGGFPDHPHRGFETVSYLLEGSLVHEDCNGRRGVLRPGDLQWMTAGRGVVHSEMPLGEGRVHGMQLWVNLSKENKMVESAYQEHVKEEIKSAEKEGVKVKVIAGESMGVASPVRTRTPTYYLDFTVQPGSGYEQELPAGWTIFAYILTGEVAFGPDKKVIQPHHTVVFERPNSTSVVSFQNPSSNSEARFVLIGGQPLGEPVAQRGPFVMNTQQELADTMMDFQLARNGFEGANTWRSVEGNK